MSERRRTALDADFDRWAVANGELAEDDWAQRLAFGDGAAAPAGQRLLNVDEIQRRLVPGGTFLLDEPEGTPAVVGTGSNVVWAEGESLVIVGPTGVGKSTLAGQLVRGRIGLLDHVLGWPVARGKRRTLYLAADRPRQIARALRRGVTDADRPTLDDKLVFWKGPPPRTLAEHPTLLVEMAQAADADTIFLDSLKDMAPDLTGDEAGLQINNAIQRALADGIEVAVTHHQRKGVGGTKPKTLEDTYGSTWIVAGAGSVILLWGQAGDSIVELHHLKQPADDIGPMKVEHDHRAGTSSIYRGFDPLAFLRHSATGVTAKQAAIAQLEKSTPSDNEIRKARRQLDALVERGLAHRKEPALGGAGGSSAAIYHAVETRLEGLA